VAKNVCDQGRVKVNGREAKPSYEVKTGDVIEFQLGPRLVRVKAQVPDGRFAGDASELYEILG
jgi:ribosomal 50S subunit-recycling heat shock protein